MLASAQPSRLVTLAMWVSTGKAGRPRSKSSTQAIVFAPTPGVSSRNLRISSVSHPRNVYKEKSPKWEWTLFKTSRILRAFMLDNPPERMTSLNS